MQHNNEPQSRFFSPLLHTVILVILFVSAFALRAYNIEGPPLDFHPTRQYHSAIIARRYYLQSLNSIPKWREDVINADKQRRDIKEPPFMELLASIAYRIIGSERLSLPRMFSSIFWLIGGVFLYLLAKQIGHPDAALFSAAFYLFLHYAIVASRSFQPDPLMTMMLIVSIYTIFTYYQKPSRTRMTIAIIVSALALLVKPVCVFAIFATFIALGIHHLGLRKALINSHFFIFALLSCLPSACYYGYHLFMHEFVKFHASRVFLPHLLLSSFFWNGWLVQVQKVVGFVPFVSALIGTLIATKKEGKALIIGLWVAYFAYAVINTYPTYTHDYYHLPLIPLVALSLGQIAGIIVKNSAAVNTRWYTHLSLLVTILLALYLVIYQVKPKLATVQYDRLVKSYKEVGEVVNHSTNTVFLAHFYGAPLQYYGEISGYNWPNTGDFRASAVVGELIPNAEERFDASYANRSPEFFIVTDLRDFEQQPDLINFLTEKFPLFARNPNYVIFDLRKKR